MTESVCLCVSPYIGDQCGSIDEKERKERYSNIATGVNYVNYIVASSSSWSKSLWNPKAGGTRIRGSEGYCLLSKVSEHLHGACTYLPNGQAYQASTWLFGNAGFTRITPHCRP